MHKLLTLPELADSPILYSFYYDIDMALSRMHELGGIVLVFRGDTHIYTVRTKHPGAISLMPEG